MEPQLLSMTQAEYLADPCPRPSLSSSVAHTLISESPLHAWLKHPKLGHAPRESSDSMDRGTIIHALLFGTMSDNVLIVDADDWRTKAAKEKRADAYLMKKTPVLKCDMEDAQEVAEHLRREVQAAGIELGEISERAAVWEEDTPAGKVLCRGMIDNLNAARIIDLKTCRSAHPSSCAKHVIEYGYDIQFAAYTSFLRKYQPECAGREDFVWLFAEELPPGSPRRVILTVARPDGAMQELGRARWAKACQRWAECMASGHWPAYADSPVRLEPPAWAVKQELESSYI